MANILQTGVDYRSINDIKYMRSYLMQLNDDLRYMFNNIDPEDNFSEEGLKSYMQTDEYIAELEHGLDSFQSLFEKTDEDLRSGLLQSAGNIALYVSKGDVTNQISISKEKIRIDASRIHSYADNFYVDDEILRIRGEVESNAGMIGGFTMTRGDNGNMYLAGASGSAITAGQAYGAFGEFGSLECHKDIVMNNEMWQMWNCRIISSGLTFTAGFAAGNVDIARYNADTDMYTAWYALTCKEKIDATEIHVGKNWDDSGQVRCLSVYSYFEGAERPEASGDENSDKRLKIDEEEIDQETAYAMIKAVRPVRYRLKEDEVEQLGVVAQEVLKLQERFGDYGIVSAGDDGFLTVNYMRFIPLMAAAMKKMDEEIEKCRCL